MIFVRATNLLGIKTEISDINKTDIREMILSKFNGLSLQEIDYAFKLDRWSGDPVEHFQLFNAEYVAKVLTKYQEWLRSTRAANNLPLSKPKKKQEMNDTEKELLIIGGVLECFEIFKVTKEIPVGKTYVYDFLYEKKLLPKHTTEFKSKIKRKAIKEAYKSKAEAEDKRAFTKVLRDIQNKKNAQIVRCKNIILKTFFHQLIAQEKSLEEII